MRTPLLSQPPLQKPKKKFLKGQSSPMFHFSKRRICILNFLQINGDYPEVAKEDDG